MNGIILCCYELTILDEKFNFDYNRNDFWLFTLIGFYFFFQNQLKYINQYTTSV